MSTLSQFGGGGIKSIQRGVISITGAASATATVTSVNTAKTELRFLGTSYGSGTMSPDQALAYLSLTNSTTITATRSGTSATAVNVAWELVERF